jgi:O-antigen ligase
MQWGIHEAHSAYFEAMLNVGMVGAIALLSGVLIATWRARQRYLTTRETGYDFLFALFVFALINSLTESGMVMPMFVPFLAGCGLARLAFYGAENADGVCSQTKDIKFSQQRYFVGA